jgi:4-hydroxy-tetrahydrodipicolinate synthase
MRSGAPSTDRAHGLAFPRVSGYERLMSKPFTLAGSYTAIVTPFQDDSTGAIDLRSLDALIDAQIEGGMTGLVPCGTTGESPALSADEQTTVIRRVVQRARAAKRSVQVIAGTGTNATRSTIERSQAAEQAGVDAVMVVVPYYNKPTQDGLARHFISVAGAVSCPVVIYNIPGRTGSDLLPEALARILEAAPNVVGIKESTGNVLRAQELCRRFGARLSVLSGDDALTLPMMAAGAKGVISVTSNLMPKDVSRLVELTADGRLSEARTLHLALLPVHEAMFIESNPGPVKAALAMAGRMSDVVRSPLVAASPATRAAIQAVLDVYERGMA